MANCVLSQLWPLCDMITWHTALLFWLYSRMAKNFNQTDLDVKQLSLIAMQSCYTRVLLSSSDKDNINFIICMSGFL